MTASTRRKPYHAQAQRGVFYFDEQFDDACGVTEELLLAKADMAFDGRGSNSFMLLLWNLAVG
jgi:hypothetical protein